MPRARDLRTASKSELRDAIVHGHAVDPRAIEGWVYRGTSLGLPSLVERLTWKTFQKTFWRDPRSGRLFGWNVRLEQDGIDAPSRPKTRRGRAVTEWNYEVIAPAGVPMPRGFDRGLVIDYGRAPNPPGVVRVIKDPLVALSEGSAEELLGVSYVVVGARCLETPTYFTLVRERRIERRGSRGADEVACAHGCARAHGDRAPLGRGDLRRDRRQRDSNVDANVGVAKQNYKVG